MAKVIQFESSTFSKRLLSHHNISVHLIMHHYLKYFCWQKLLLPCQCVLRFFGFSEQSFTAMEGATTASLAWPCPEQDFFVPTTTTTQPKSPEWMQKYFYTESVAILVSKGAESSFVCKQVVFFLQNGNKVRSIKIVLFPHSFFGLFEWAFCIALPEKG